jgi:TolA-binding protein
VERSSVERHLRLCVACRFAASAARAYDRAAERSDLLVGIDLHAAVARTLERLPQPAGGSAAGGGPGRRRSAARSPWLTIRASTAIAALVMFGGAAAAALVVAERARSARPPAAGSPTSVGQPGAARVRPPRSSSRPAPSAPAAAPPPEAVNTPPVSPVGDVDGALASRPRAATLAPFTPRPRARVVASAPAPAPSAPTAPEGSAAELFAQANRSRREGRSAEASALYDRLWKRFPASEEARASRALVGRWLLDRSAYADAVTAFEDYLRVAPHGPLEEEVLVGLASAFERAGRDAEAAGAWRRIAETHPGTAYAGRAREHLARLSSHAGGSVGP